MGVVELTILCCIGIIVLTVAGVGIYLITRRKTE